MTKAIFGIANDKAHAEKIVNRLNAEGFPRDCLSLIMADSSKKTLCSKEGSFETEKNTKAPQGGIAGVTAGGLLGGSLGLLAGIGTIAIPGLGAFIAAGPIMAALSGTALGGGVGLLVGSLVGVGISEDEAKKYESSLQGEKVLISVHLDEKEDLDELRKILEQEGARDISSTIEKSKSY